MADYQLYIRKNGGAWFPSGADPVANTGGIDLSAMAGTLMYPTFQGSGDGNLTCNFGASSFADPPPSGYTPGWPHAGAGFTTLDPTKLFGSAALSGGDLVGTFNTVAGVAQAVDGYTNGKYYLEATLAGRDLFSNSFGGGVGANYTINGGDFNFWFSGAFKTGDALGGGGVSGGSLGGGFEASLFALGSTVASDVFTFDNGDVIGYAVFLTSGAPPTPGSAQTGSQGLGRWRGLSGINWHGMALVGDAFSNVVGLSDFNVFQEYGNGMQWLITSPPVHSDRKRVFVPRFEIQVEAGLGLPNDPATAPLMTLEVSRDGGQTFLPLQKARSMGKIGQYLTRLRWLNLGNSRQWVFRLRYSDSARPALIGTYIDSYIGLG